MKSVFSVRLKKRRLEMDMTVKQLGDACGLSHGCISQYENCIREPGYDTLMRLSSVLNLTVNYLVGKSEYSMDDLFTDERMIEMLEGLTRLPDEKKNMVFTFYDALVRFEQSRRRAADDLRIANRDL